MTLAIKRSPGGARSRRRVKRRAALAINTNNRTQREWCPVLRVPPAAAIGAPGEQKHLPEWIDTTAAKSGAPAPLYNVR